MARSTRNIPINTNHLLYSVNLVPAYGLDYKSPNEVLHAWVSGRDFKIADIGNAYNGSYTSNRDWSGQSVRIRFNRLTDFVIIHGELLV